ncbi:hypothetical protein RFI_24915, partial [Reticulomyxa filosa]
NVNVNVDGIALGKGQDRKDIMLCDKINDDKATATKIMDTENAEIGTSSLICRRDAIASIHPVDACISSTSFHPSEHAECKEVTHDCIRAKPMSVEQALQLVNAWTNHKEKGEEEEDGNDDDDDDDGDDDDEVKDASLVELDSESISLPSSSSASSVSLPFGSTEEKEKEEEKKNKEALTVILKNWKWSESSIAMLICKSAGIVPKQPKRINDSNNSNNNNDKSNVDNIGTDQIAELLPLATRST